MKWVRDHLEKEYVIEPRFPNGDLDAKRVGENPELSRLGLGCIQEQVFKYYFSKNRFVESVGWEEVVKWLNEQGYYVREKTW